MSTSELPRVAEPARLEAPAPRLGPILGELDVPVAFTLLGLLFAFLCITFAIEGHPYHALVALCAAGLVDFFDGWVARKCHPGGVRTVMSSRLDAIVDLCSFGMAPAVLAFTSGLKSPVYVVLLALYLGANALRLGYFTSRPHTVIDGQRYYIGLPVTFVALFIPWAFLAGFVLPGQLFQPLLAGVYTALAAAMVSGFRLRKPAGIWYAVYTLIGLVPMGCFVWAIAGGR